MIESAAMRIISLILISFLFINCLPTKAKKFNFNQANSVFSDETSYSGNASSYYFNDFAGVSIYLSARSNKNKKIQLQMQLILEEGFFDELQINQEVDIFTNDLLNPSPEAGFEDEFVNSAANASLLLVKRLNKKQAAGLSPNKENTPIGKLTVLEKTDDSISGSIEILLDNVTNVNFKIVNCTTKNVVCTDNYVERKSKNKNVLRKKPISIKANFNYEISKFERPAPLPKCEDEPFEPCTSETL